MKFIIKLIHLIRSEFLFMGGAKANTNEERKLSSFLTFIEASKEIEILFNPVIPVDNRFWSFVLKNFLEHNRQNYFGTIVYINAGGSRKRVYTGYECFIVLLLVIKALYDTSGQSIKIRYLSLLKNIFLSKDKANNYAFKITSSAGVQDINKLFEIIDEKFYIPNDKFIESINDSSSSELICYRFFFDKFLKTEEKEKERLFTYLFSQDNAMILFSERTENKMFRSCEKSDLNACVGTNGWNDITTYTDGYKWAVDAIYCTIINDSSHIDGYIYPLCFNARHYIELFLKRTAMDIHSLLESQEKTQDSTFINSLKKTHDLSILYKKTKDEAVIFDERIADMIVKLEEYISDFSELDPTGETFRYPYNQNNEHSLDSLSCINAEIFYNRFNEVKKIEDNCFWLLEFLMHEYKTGTYTKKCSRFVIEQIAKDLPPKSAWKDVSFIDVKKNLMLKYNITSKELSKVIDIIKKHPEFAEKIGCPIKFTSLTEEKYLLYELILMNGDIEDCGSETCAVIQEFFSKDELGCLYTFLELGKDENYYSENFQSVFDYLKNSNPTDFVRHLFYNPESKRNWILKGIRKCGQSHLLK